MGWQILHSPAVCSHFIVQHPPAAPGQAGATAAPLPVVRERQQPPVGLGAADTS